METKGGVKPPPKKAATGRRTPKQLIRTESTLRCLFQSKPFPDSQTSEQVSFGRNQES